MIHYLNASACSKGTTMAQMPQAHYHFFIGDETAVGLFILLLRSLSDLGQCGMGLIVAVARDDRFPELAELLLDIVVTANSVYAEIVHYFLYLPEEIWLLRKTAPFHLAGTERFVSSARQFLLTNGVTDAQIITYSI